MSDNSRFKSFIVKSKIELFGLITYYTGLSRIGQKIYFMLKTYPILIDENKKKIYDYNAYIKIDKKKIKPNLHHKQLSVGEYTTTGKRNYVKNDMYIRYQIPKNNKSGFRILDVPSKMLKTVQRAILTSIFNKFEFPDLVTGFVKSRDPAFDARQHPNTKWSIRIDIKDFFRYITMKHIVSALKHVGYEHELASMIAELCTFHGYLPQGAPTSPFLANLVAYLYFDKVLEKIAAAHELRYTRYADDMFFSSDKKREPVLKKKLMNQVEIIVKLAGFQLNKKKCHRLGKGIAHKRMGNITIHQDKPKILNKRVDIIRSHIQKIRDFGLEKTVEILKEKYDKHFSPNKLIKHVNGNISYIYSVYPERGIKLREKFREAMDKYDLGYLVPATIHHLEILDEEKFRGDNVQ